jgi:hypothetical protein
MSEPKKYVLELSAEELDPLKNLAHRSVSLADKLARAFEAAEADREAEDLRLPWRVSQGGDGQFYVEIGALHWRSPSARVAKLMSAAPELLEAVKAADAYPTEQHMECKCGAGEDWDGEWMRTVQPLIDRAIRKVATGVPE